MAGAVCLLPKSHPNPATWTNLIAKQKALRLHSLVASPESFSSTYERESAFKDSDWEARLQNPLAYTYVAKSEAAPLPQETVSSEDYLETFLNDAWVGSAVLVGPAGDSDMDEDWTATFDIYALYVLPEARGSGLGSALIDACTVHARDMAGAVKASKAVIRVSVARGNEGVLGLYERIGFLEKDGIGDGYLGANARVLVKEMKVEV